MPFVATESAAGAAVGSSTVASAGRGCTVRERPPALWAVMRPPAMVATRSDNGIESSGSCDESSTVAPSATASPITSASKVRAGGVEPRMRLVEQPQGGATGDEGGQGHAPALSGREATDWGGAQAPHQAETLECRVTGPGTQSERSDRETDVLGRVELVIEGGGVAQEADMAPYRGVVLGQVHPKDVGLP